MTAKVCSFEYNGVRCKRPQRTRGMCKLHYQQYRRSTDTRTCDIMKDGVRCGKPAHAARGWCGMHYQRWRHHGDPLWTPTPAETFWSYANRDAVYNNISGVRGVDLHKPSGKWRARVNHHGKTFHLGYFKSLAAAESAVTVKRIEMFNQLAGVDRISGGTA